MRSTLAADARYPVWLNNVQLNVRSVVSGLAQQGRRLEDRLDVAQGRLAQDYWSRGRLVTRHCEPGVAAIRAAMQTFAPLRFSPFADRR